MAEYFKGLLSFALRLGVILIPLLTLLELVKGRWEGKKLKGVERFLSAEAAMALLAGLLFGLLYGAGVIVSSLREGGRRQEAFAVVTFLAVFHSVFEDTMLFVAAGADPLFITLPRAAVAVLLFLPLRYLLRR
ncbi:MAG: nucleoside recognition protein [Deltaproteobacteria bacterium]|nr:MAG: nucleoside recognition protein [Deltaproteobacteria bacterium]